MQKFPKLLLTLLLGTVAVSAPGSAVTFLQERFNGATFPPAGWTVVDNAGSGVVWTNVAGSDAGSNYTGGGGDAASVISDFVGFFAYDTELITPPIPLPGTPSTKFLHFLANYQDRDAWDLFAVDLSTNGGASWGSVITPWSADHGAFETQPGECVSVDVSAVIGAASSAQFRFRYHNSGVSDLGWYAQVDDVILNDQATVPCPIFGDGFDGGNRSAWSLSVPAFAEPEPRGEQRRRRAEMGNRRRLKAGATESELRPGHRRRVARLKDAALPSAPAEPSASPRDSAPPRR